MKTVPVYVDHYISGSTPDSTTLVGVPAHGLREHHNPTAAILPFLPPFLTVAFYLVCRSVIDQYDGLAATLVIILSVVLLLVSSVAVSVIKTSMDMSLNDNSVDWFDPELLGLDHDHRRDLLISVECIQSMRDEDLSRQACDKLQEIHGHATWLTEHYKEVGTERFIEHQERIRAIAQSLNGDIEQGVMNEQDDQDRPDVGQDGKH